MYVSIFRHLEEQDGRNWLNQAVNMLRKTREQGEIRVGYIK
jgi:hypothetical protein